MAAIDFPANPTNGQAYTYGTTTWRWDGTKWSLVDRVVQGPAGAGTAILYSQLYV